LLDGIEARQEEGEVFLRTSVTLTTMGEGRTEYPIEGLPADASHLWIVGIDNGMTAAEVMPLQTMVDEALAADRGDDIANLLNTIYGSIEFVIPLVYRPLDVRPIESFSRRFLGVGTARSFNRTFGNLIAFADGIERLPLQDFRDVLDSEMRRTGPQVRLFGFVL
jgi:hypothetical protein